jgi:hypothetical protein
MLIQPGQGFHFGTLRPVPAMTNAERQRKFQDAHPGYDRRRKARERAMAKRGAALFVQALQAKAADAAPAEPLALPATVAVPAMPVPAVARLALPAPVVDPVMAELEALGAALASSRARARAAQPVRLLPAAA